MVNLIEIEIATDSPAYGVSVLLTQPGVIPALGDVIELPVPEETPDDDPTPLLVMHRFYKTRWIEEGKLQITGVLLYLADEESYERRCLFQRGTFQRETL